MEKYFKTCIGKFSFGNHEKHPTFSRGWKIPTGDPLVDNITEEFQFRTSKELDGYPFVGQMSTYPGSGYVVQWRGSESKLQQKVDELQVLYYGRFLLKYQS